MAYRIYIVEDHSLMRETFQMLVRQHDDLAICGMAETGAQALAELPAEVDLVVVDMSLPDMNGAELVRRLRAEWPTIPCLILSGHGERSYVESALKAGAHGYVLKGEPREIPEAMRQVAQGNRFLSRRLGWAMDIS